MVWDITLHTEREAVLENTSKGLRAVFMIRKNSIIAFHEEQSSPMGWEDLDGARYALMSKGLR